MVFFFLYASRSTTHPFFFFKDPSFFFKEKTPTKREQHGIYVPSQASQPSPLSNKKDNTFLIQKQKDNGF
jgi:hypothetical protein